VRNGKLFLAVIGVISVFVVGCSMLVDETEKANAIIGKANEIITKNNADSIKSSELFNELLGDGISEVSDIEKHKNENKAKFDELIQLNDKIAQNYEEIAGMFEASARLKIGDVYREYLTLKSREFRIRAEAEKIVSPMVRKFLETKTMDDWNKETDKFNEKSSKLIAEADELGKRADKIASDNPTLIK